MCYRISADSFIINYFNKRKGQLPLSELQDTAYKIMEKCEFTIIIDSNYGMIENAVHRYYDFFEMKDLILKLREDHKIEDLQAKALLTQKRMPNYVVQAINDVLDEKNRISA